MSIEFLRLRGFKSFGVSCEFSFPDGFTAIVGPNGSGKSNILDALRWALGEASPSLLRILRQSDLVFQGSATVDPSKEAEVTLRLREKGVAATLQRIYSAEGGAVFLVDGSRIRLQDLAEFKAKFMLEGDSFAFIGQGEVSEAIHQRPMQRRHQLESLFGIDRYRRRREEISQKLVNAGSEIERINTLTSELENRRQEIAPEVAVAVKAQGIIDNLENARRDYYFSKRISQENKIKEHRKTIQLLSAHKDLAGGWQQLWVLALANAERTAGESPFDEDAFLAREQELLQQKETLRKNLFASSSRVLAILTDRRALSVAAAELEKNMIGVASELTKTQAQEKTLRGELQSRRDAWEETLRKMEAGRAELEKRRAQRQQLQDSLAAGSLRRSRAEARAKALESLLTDTSTELTGLDKRLAALKTETAAETEAERLSMQRQEQLAAEHTDAYAACQRLAASLQQLRREKISLEAESDALRDSTESSVYPEPVRMLTSAARLGRMNSRPEVAAEVFSCPPELAVALEAYLGGRQYWLLVRTFDEAREGIELLKQRRGGRVTYLPLERCRPRFPDARFRLPLNGVVGWALELITVRSPWEPALQHMLGDLLIVSDYQLAAKMVKDGARFPIATSDGEVFAPSGTVSGGRTRQSGGAIARGQKLAELSAQLETVNSSVNKLSAELAATEKREQETALAQQKLDGELLALRGELAQARQKLAEAESDLRRVTDDAQAAAQELAQLREEIASTDTAVADVEARLSALGQEELGADESAGTAAQKEIELAEERLNGVSNVLTRILKERSDLQARIDETRNNIFGGEAEEKALRERLAELGRGHCAVWQELQKLRETAAHERGRASKETLRLEWLRARGRKAASNMAVIEADIDAAGEKINVLTADITQLHDMWDEKYPYDADEAAEIEGGRDLTASMRRLERELKALGTYNLGALSEDESLMERIDYLQEQLEDVRTGMEELQRLIDETDLQVETIFKGAMNDIDTRFNALFHRLFGGGEARLTLQEEGGVWDRGVEIFARPPGKRLQNISQLSGGEQSLTAIAQLFAALEVAKMPIAVLDEVDAALDEYNLIRFADLAKEYAAHMQLLVMTHRRATMERADVIYGVTMVEPGLSKIVGIDVDSYR